MVHSDAGRIDCMHRRYRLKVFCFGLCLNIWLVVRKGAIWVLAEQYGVGSVGSEWPGVSLLLNTILVTISGLLFFFGRPKNAYGSI